MGKALVVLLLNTGTGSGA